MSSEKRRRVYKCHYYVIRKLKRRWINGKIKTADCNENESVTLNTGNIGAVQAGDMEMKTCLTPWRRSLTLGFWVTVKAPSVSWPLLGFNFQTMRCPFDNLIP